MLDALDPTLHQATAEWRISDLAMEVVRPTIAHRHRAIEAAPVAARASPVAARASPVAARASEERGGTVLTCKSSYVWF